jgi:hypothetical protein
MKPTVFYSWQSDLHRKSTRDIIHAAALQAITRLFNRLSLEDSPRLDHDTAGEAGAPEIAGTIYSKIKESAVFLADVTFVGETLSRENKAQKLLPNPNVFLELGYAAAILGWKRIILVMNREYGPPERLPFDLKNRRFPITFSATTSPETYNKATESLTDDLENAIQLCLQADYERVETTLARLSSYARRMMVENGSAPRFWESKGDNQILSRLDLAIQQFLEFGVVRCITAVGDAGLRDTYEWTYLGRQCISKLGVSLTASPVPIANQFNQQLVITNDQWIEQYLPKNSDQGVKEEGGSKPNE